MSTRSRRGFTVLWKRIVLSTRGPLKNSHQNRSGHAKVTHLQPAVSLRGEKSNDYGERYDSERFRVNPRTGWFLRARLKVRETGCGGGKTMSGIKRRKFRSEHFLDYMKRRHSPLLRGNRCNPTHCQWGAFGLGAIFRGRPRSSRRFSF